MRSIKTAWSNFRRLHAGRCGSDGGGGETRSEASEERASAGCVDESSTGCANPASGSAWPAVKLTMSGQATASEAAGLPAAPPAAALSSEWFDKSFLIVLCHFWYQFFN